VVNLSRVLFCTHVLTILCFFLLDLANLVNIAAMKAAVEGADKLASAQLEFAKDRIIMGTERKTMIISDESRKACQFFCFSFL
jgi:ATP-dependent Zn protease